MGFFDTFSSSSTTSSSPSPPPPKPSPDGAFEAPSRTDRSKCWAARDAFFACLDANGIIDSIKEGEKADSVCGDQERNLRKDCASSWVTYFKQRRVMEHKKKALMEGLQTEGAKPMGSETDAAVK